MRRQWRALGGAVMDDIISQGPDPGKGPWPRRVAIGVIVLAVAAVLVVQHLPRGTRHEPRSSGPARAAGPALGPSVRIRPGRPDGITGPTASWAAGLRLPVGGDQPAWYWPATGLTEPIGGLPAGPDYVFTRADAGWAVQRALACAGCAAMPVYFLADEGRSAVAVGMADRVAPAAEPGKLWLTTFPPGDSPESTAGIAREVSVSTGQSGPPVQLPAGYLIDAATSRGLLLEPAVQRGPALRYDLWDPVLGRVIRRLRGVIAASAGRIAWTPPCATRCSVRVLDLASGRQTQITLPRGSSAARGVFSQDGSLLALELSFGNGGDGGAVATRLEVAAMPAGRLTVVPGTWASSDALTGFGWPSRGDDLVAELSFVTKVQVASWHPGARRLAVALVWPGRNPNFVVVG